MALWTQKENSVKRRTAKSTCTFLFFFLLKNSGTQELNVPGPSYRSESQLCNQTLLKPLTIVH